MDSHDCDHRNCTHGATPSVCQTMTEMDWERGLWNAAFNNDKERVEALIAKARNAREVVNTPDNNGYAPLHYAARNGHIDVCKMLIKYGANVNAQTKSGMATPLHKAAVAGKDSTVELLIASGANINLQDVDGQTAMHKACDNKHQTIANILREASPTVAQIKDNKGRTPLYAEVHTN